MFNTRVSVYFQGNRKCSFLPGLPAFICIDVVFSCTLKLNDVDDDDDDDDENVAFARKIMVLPESGGGQPPTPVARYACEHLGCLCC